MKQATLKQKIRYRFDSFMARGGASIFLSLLFVFLGALLLLGILRGIIFALNPELAVQWDKNFVDNVYIVFIQLMDPGNMAQDIDSGTPYRLVAILGGTAGVIMLSALIAFITTALDQKISELKRGRSKVIEDDHTLILGWNEQRVIEIIRELIIANESEDDACVVILADEDKEHMDDILRLRLPSTLSTRIVTRSGDISSLASLDIASTETCKSAIVLATCNDADPTEAKEASDAHVIQTVLAITRHRENTDEFAIVVEIFNQTYREVVEKNFPDQVVTVNTLDILAKILVQTSRSVGLSVVYNEILSFDGCEMYFHGADWNGVTFAELPFRFPDGVPLGIRAADGSLSLNPATDVVLKDDDEILILADDDSTIEFKAASVAQPKDYDLEGSRQQQGVEKELILGWTEKAPIVLREYADYVNEGSRIDVMLSDPTEKNISEIKALDEELEDISVQLIESNRLNRDDLMSVEPFTYDNIIILAGGQEGMDSRQVDSENIVTLLMLREIFRGNPDQSGRTKLITEVLDSQNSPLVAEAGVKDVIISNRLVSMILAQVSESTGIKDVYDDIFQEDGSEIYLKPAALYFKSLPADFTFADMIRIAQTRGEICLGVKIKADENNADSNNGVQLIPPKDKSFRLTEIDSLVVLSEDET
ncbi:MAG: hypothetical protein AAF483_11935 [Planctomycetota bacterium]